MSRNHGRILTPDGFATIPWKNGGGVATIVAGERRPGAAPEDWSETLWQLGQTAIVTPAPFSDLTGFTRLQMVIRGGGLFLDSTSGTIDLSHPWVVQEWDGGLAVVSRLTQGPVEVVNLVYRRGLVTASMRVLAVGDSATITVGTHVLFAPIGEVAVEIDGEVMTLANRHAFETVGNLRLRIARGILVAASIVS